MCARRRPPAPSSFHCDLINFWCKSLEKSATPVGILLSRLWWQKSRLWWQSQVQMEEIVFMAVRNIQASLPPPRASSKAAPALYHCFFLPYDGNGPEWRMPYFRKALRHRYAEKAAEELEGLKKTRETILDKQMYVELWIQFSEVKKWNLCYLDIESSNLCYFTKFSSVENTFMNQTLKFEVHPPTSEPS